MRQCSQRLLGSSAAFVVHPNAAHIVPGAFEARISRFPCGDIKVELDQPLIDARAVVVQGLYGTHSLGVLLAIVDAVLRRGCSCIDVLVPYFSYLRQESLANLMIMALRGCGVRRVYVIEPHVRLDSIVPIGSASLFLGEVAPNALIVSPDEGGRIRAESFGLEFAVLSKIRTNGDCRIDCTVDVRGRDCVIFDDLVDSGMTLLRATEALRNARCAKVSACITHFVPTSEGVERIKLCQLDRLIVSDSVKRLPISSESLVKRCGDLLNRSLQIQRVTALFHCD